VPPVVVARAVHGYAHGVGEEPEWVAAIRGWYAGRGPSAVDVLDPVLSPDFVWIPPGRDNPLQAVYRGGDGMRRFLEAMGGWNQRAWPELLDLVTGERYAVAIVEGAAKRARDGHEDRWQFLHRWRAEDGLITECRAFVDDQRRYDEFYAPPQPA
jgi:ketosteroid isomerase-like protein